ncbi:unnamed protein product [Darwinula stevensoni]|uniref:Uncharacterized protein n=1 Tax=Darwinula stevensoni TaxID=69355 RepID=A0A7R9AG79_9CRUS|nr:unnamed protein product [Darwinula stevensoni]CAG0903975.1 unnamed protein product [Darwinula stevensoni]
MKKAQPLMGDTNFQELIQVLRDFGGIDLANKLEQERKNQSKEEDGELAKDLISRGTITTEEMSPVLESVPINDAGSRPTS